MNLWKEQTIYPGNHRTTAGINDEGLSGQNGHFFRYTEGSMKEKIFAPDIENLISSTFGGHVIGLESPEQLQALDELFDVLSVIKPCGSDGLREIWIKADRGTADDYGNYEDYLDDEIRTKKDFEDYFDMRFPDPVYWYHLAIVEHDGYNGVFLGRRHVMERNPHQTRESGGWGEIILPYIHWMIDAAKVAIAKLRDGTYNGDIRANLPLEHRTGTILRKDLWERIHGSREYDMEGLTQDEADRFAQMMDGVTDKPEPEGRIQQMTAGMFYRTCALGYKANNYEGCDLSPKEQYYRHADGRDEGLSEIDPEDAATFDTWFHDRHRYGGHPWEICRGGNSTHVDLYVHEDKEGYYFRLAGDHRRAEVIRFYLALRDAGLPVTISNGRLIAAAVQATDKIGIVPEGIFPRYCGSMFPGEEILDFINLSDEDWDKIVDCIMWQDEPLVELMDAAE